MTGCSWSFSLSEVSTMSLHRFVHCGLCFPSLMLLPDISAYTPSLVLPVSTCLSTFEGSGLPHVLLFLWDSRRVVAFSVCSIFFLLAVRTQPLLPKSLHAEQETRSQRCSFFIWKNISHRVMVKKEISSDSLLEFPSLCLYNLPLFACCLFFHESHYHINYG